MNVMIGIDPHKASHTAVAIGGDEDQLSRYRYWCRPGTGTASWKCQAGTGATVSSMNRYFTRPKISQWGTCGARNFDPQILQLRKPPLNWSFTVVGTGVDPVTSRFSGARSTY
jgi:hypothetical protein